MVEGHSVHRVARAHSVKLVGSRFRASSPNGRFAVGAAAITGLVLEAVQAHGKNLFYFFGGDSREARPPLESSSTVVMHVHFGMSGAFKIFPLGCSEPAVTATTRLRLEQLLPTPTQSATEGVAALPLLGGHLSAMTVQHGGIDLYHAKVTDLGADPLREDADPELLWSRVTRSRCVAAEKYYLTEHHCKRG
jgi:formamidopyrimidine-DNA glycosylase